jgi:hypothetical protein
MAYLFTDFMSVCVSSLFSKNNLVLLFFAHLKQVAANSGNLINVPGGSCTTKTQMNTSTKTQMNT